MKTAFHAHRAGPNALASDKAPAALTAEARGTNEKQGKLDFAAARREVQEERATEGGHHA